MALCRDVAKQLGQEIMPKPKPKRGWARESFIVILIRKLNASREAASDFN